MAGFRRTWKYDPFLPNSGSFLKIRENSDNNFLATNFLIFDFETSSQWILLCPSKILNCPQLRGSEWIVNSGKVLEKYFILENYWIFVFLIDILKYEKNHHQNTKKTKNAVRSVFAGLNYTLTKLFCFLLKKLFFLLVIIPCLHQSG